MRYLWVLTILLCLGVIMGKAEIVSGGEDGKYTAKIQYNTDNIEQQITDIDARLEELGDAMTELEDEKSEYEDREGAAKSNMEAELDAWMAEFEAWRSEMAGQDFPPLFAGITIPEDFVKDKWSDRIKHTLRDEAYEPEPSRSVTLAGQFPALEGAPAMDNLVKAQTEYGKMRAAIDAIEREISYKEYEQEELRKRKEELQGVLDTLEADEREVWCADLTEDLTGEQQTIEVKGEPTQILLTPGWRNPQNGNPHWSLDAGKLMPIMGMSAAQAAFNYMILPGWQKFKPMYRVGTISDIDYGEHTATVELDEALSVAQDLDVNQSTTLESVPVKYMECDANAFEVEDRVVVEFTGQDWSSPQIIGFETNPQPCEWHLAIIDAPMGEFSGITFPTGFNGTVVLVGAGGLVGDVTGSIDDGDYQLRDSGGIGGAGGGAGYEIYPEVHLDAGNKYSFRIGSYADQTNGKGDTYLATVGRAYAGGQGGSVDLSTGTVTPGLKGQGNAGQGGGAVFVVAQNGVEIDGENWNVLDRANTSTGAEPGHVFWHCRSEESSTNVVHAAVGGAGGGPDNRLPEHPVGLFPPGYDSLDWSAYIWHPPEGVYLPDLLPEEQGDLVDQHESIRYICSGSLGADAVWWDNSGPSDPDPFGCRVSPCTNPKNGYCDDFADKGYHGYGSGAGQDSTVDEYEYVDAGQGVIILISQREIEYEIE